MPNGIGTVQYRVYGNIYQNKHYVQGADVAACVASVQAIIEAMSLVQTVDVEYLTASFTEAEGNHITTPITPTVRNGIQNGGSTAPGINFLQFVFRSTVTTKRVTHRIRGYFNDSATSLGAFNAATGGDSDLQGNTVPAPLDSGLTGYLIAVAANSVDGDYNPIIGSSKVTVGAKRATSRL